MRTVYSIHIHVWTLEYGSYSKLLREVIGQRDDTWHSRGTSSAPRGRVLVRRRLKATASVRYIGRACASVLGRVMCYADLYKYD